MKFALLSSNVKLKKAEKFDWTNLGLALAASPRVCPMSLKAGCLATCLTEAGNNAFREGVARRQRLTEWLYTDTPGFLRVLDAEIALASAIYRNLCVRLNLFSDIDWSANWLQIEGKTLFERHPSVAFVDYTKRESVYFGSTEPNRYLTMSYWSNGTADNLEACRMALQGQGSVAVIFDVGRGKPLPTFWRGFPVIDGDISDLRHLDPPGVIVGLRYKQTRRAGAKALALRQGLIQIAE